MFVKIKMEVEAANRATKDGSLPKLIEDFTRTFKPEGMWFVAQDGRRCMVAVFDLASTTQIPTLAEPFFHALGAAVELTPAMDLADLRAGLGGL
jgi:hypothetical protein